VPAATRWSTQRAIRWATYELPTELPPASEQQPWSWRYGRGTLVPQLPGNNSPTWPRRDDSDAIRSRGRRTSARPGVPRRRGRTGLTSSRIRRSTNIGKSRTARRAVWSDFPCRRRKSAPVRRSCSATVPCTMRRPIDQTLFGRSTLKVPVVYLLHEDRCCNISLTRTMTSTATAYRTLSAKLSELLEDSSPTG
jgi:hypothetical protein